MTSMDLDAFYRQYEEEEKIENLDVGEYELEIVGANAKPKNKGITITPICRLYSGPYKGRKCFIGSFTLSPEAAHIFFQNVEAWGLDKPTLDRLTQGLSDHQAQMDAIAKALVGRIAKVRLVENKYQGEIRTQMAIGGAKLIGYRDEGGQVQQVAGETAAPAAPVAPTPTTPSEPAGEPQTAPAAPPAQPPQTPSAPPAAPEPEQQAPAETPAVPPAAPGGAPF